MAGQGSASQPPHILVRWDIDHTLIETRGIGRAIYERAFPAVTGKPLRRLAEVAGRTELVIMHDTLQLHDIEPSEQMMRRLAAALIQGHEDARAELAVTGRVLPGAKKTLEVFGLDTYLDFASSAYGDDHTRRAELVTIAQQRATERMGTTFDQQHTVLIGDTPKDVEAARTAGVRVIAVASDKSNETELARAGATVTLSDLAYTATVLRLVTG